MSRRIEKAAELIKQQISILIRETLPEELGIIAVIDVYLSKDLKNATIYVSCLDQKVASEALDILDSKRKEFQLILGKGLKMRNTPKLAFKLDTGQEKLNRIESILNHIDQK